jgi:exosome complex protein LRP1
MDPVDLKPLVSTLSTQIDSLEEALEPLIKTPPHVLAAQLPLLDKSKLFVATAYAIESLIFSTLLLNGQDAKSHPIFTELTRLRQYHTKIQEAETPETARARLDTGAAARFIKHGLSGNDRYDAERAQRIAREQKMGKEKRKHIKFDEEPREAVVVVDQGPPKKKSRVSDADAMDVDQNEEERGEPSSPASDELESTKQSKQKAREDKAARKAIRREQHRLREEARARKLAAMPPEQLATYKEKKAEKNEAMKKRKEEKRAMRALRQQPFGQATGRDLEAEGIELLIPPKQAGEQGKFSEKLEEFVELSEQKAKREKKKRGRVAEGE